MIGGVDAHVDSALKPCAGHLSTTPYTQLSPLCMTRILSIPQEMARHSDDDQQWEDLPDGEWGPSPRSSSASPSSSFRGATSAVRTRRTARQRAALPTSSPRKYTHSDLRTTIRARRERDFVVELPPQEPRVTPGSERASHMYPLLRESTNILARQRSSILDLPQEAINPPVSQRGSTVERPQEPTGPPIPQRAPVHELYSKGQAGATEILNDLGASFIPVLYYVAEVLGTVLRMMKFPISIVLAIIACAYGLGIMSDAIRSALAPMCSVPVVSLLCPASGPPHPSKSDRTPQWADFPALLNVEHKSLESLLDEAVEGPGLALEIKKAEMATSDLVTLVRISKLNSREILANSLSEFVKDARKVGRGLTRFSSRVGGAMDNIIAVNDYALHCIEAANSRSSGLSLRRIWGSPPTKGVVTRAFTEAMDTLSVNMQRLVLEAQVSLSDLEKLEEHLKSIHDVVSREDSSITTARKELLAQLWTILGGNRDELNGMDEHLALLRGLSGYRDRARAHVVGALQTLETMQGDMEDLRERVATPQLVGDAIPIEVHIKSLSSVLERLKGRRTGTKKLEEQIVSRIMDGAKVTHK